MRNILFIEDVINVRLTPGNPVYTDVNSRSEVHIAIRFMLGKWFVIHVC